MNPAFSLGFTEGQTPMYSKVKSRSASFFMNVNYSYANRYLMDFNVRSDGTSKFGANKRFSTTWAVGLAWNLHNEAFVKRLGYLTISRLGLRLEIREIRISMLIRQ